MTSQLIITLAILAFMIVMFVWQKFPMGVTTMTCCALLAAFGILSPSEAFGGFTNNSIILVAPMMALSSAITKTSIVPYIRNKVNSLSGKKGSVRYPLPLGSVRRLHQQQYHSGRSHDGAEFCHHQDQHRSLYP